MSLTIDIARETLYTSMSENSAFPWYFTVNDRPVKVVATANGGMDVLVANPTTGKLERDLQYLTYCFEPGQNVERLSEAEFNLRVADLKASLGDRPTPSPDSDPC